MDIAGWGVAFALLAVFIIISFKTWVVWYHDQREQDAADKRLRELLEKPLSDEWRVPRG